MITINIQPVVTPGLTTVKFLAIQAVNLNANENDLTYGQAQYQIFDENNNIVEGNVCGFTREESDNWDTDEGFAIWLTINKLNYTPINN